MTHVRPLEPRRHFAGYVADVRFGEEGTAGGVSPAYLLAVQEGKVLTVGPYAKEGLRVARLLPDGRPDPAFGTGGVTSLAEFGQDGAAALGPDGVYAAAAPGQTSRPALRFARLNDAGRPDRSFGTGGMTGVATPVVDAGRPFYFVSVDSLAVDARGRAVFGITVSEKRGKTPGAYDRYGYVGRLTASGKPDKSFGHRGSIHIAGGGISRVAVDPAGRVLVQAVRDGDDFSTVLPPQRLTPDGLLDMKFNRNVRDTYRANGFGQSADLFPDLVMTVDAQGRALLRVNPAGELDEGRQVSPRVYRLTTTGRLDTAFGDDGVLPLPRGTQIDDPTLAADGSINVRPYQYNPSVAPVFRYDADGRFRKAFAVDADYYGTEAAVLPDGDLVLANFYGSVGKITLAARPAVVLAPSGTLNLYGTAADDVFAVDTAGDIVVVRTGGRTFSFDGDAVKSVQARLDAGRDRLTVNVGRDTRVSSDDGGDTLTTGDGDDVIGVNPPDDEGDNEPPPLGDVIRTGNGDDSVYGSDGDDTITFGDGDISLNSAGGDDTIVGGTGRATIQSRFDAGNKHITLAGGGGEIELGGGDDTVRVGGGGYVVVARGGRNRITTGSGNDTIHTNGRDTIDSGAGDDRIDVEVYNDGDDQTRARPRIVHGGPGNDVIDLSDVPAPVTLYGDAGRDSLFGGYRDDLLVGGPGADRLTGGPGRDRAVIDDLDTAVDDLASVAG